MSGLITEAVNIAAQDGEVLIDGMAGLTFSMPPEIADETGRRLLFAAVEARQQRQEIDGAAALKARVGWKPPA